MPKTKIGLSVVIPVFNEQKWMQPTIERLLKELEKTSFKSEVIVIDDGSNDNSADNAEAAGVGSSIPLIVFRQKNSGRYLARKKGVSRAKYDNILFLDSRVFVDDGSLQFLYEQIKDNQDQIWNGHVNIDKKGNIFARFWDAIVCIAWRRYFHKPRTTSYGIEEFDYYPKGTGFFFAPKSLLLDAMSYFEYQTNDVKFSSDDTLLIRYMAQKQDINISPKFSCIYHGRSTLKGFFKHAYSRGQFFVDGFLRPRTRFFVPLIGVFVLSIVLLAILIIWPTLMIKLLVVGFILFTVALFVGALLMGVIIPDALSLAILGIPFAIVYLMGLWRGLIRKL